MECDPDFRISSKYDPKQPDIVRIADAAWNQNPIETLKGIIIRIQGEIRYASDLHNYGKDEYFASPAEMFEKKSGDCVPLTEKIILQNKDTGLYEVKPIGELKESFGKYNALSYNFQTEQWEFKPITNWLSKGTKEILNAKLANGIEFNCTKDHKLFINLMRNSWKMGDRYEWEYHFVCKTLDEIQNKRGVKNVAVAKRIPELSAIDKNEDELWLEGMYLAEGYPKSKSSLRIASNDQALRNEIMKRLEKLKLSHRECIRTSGGGSYITMHHSCYAEYVLSKLGHGSLNKRIPNEYLSLSRDHLETLLRGYGLGDDYRPKPGRGWFKKAHCIHNTVSKGLADDLVLIHLILGQPINFHRQDKHMGCGTNPIYRIVVWRGGKKGSHFIERTKGLTSIAIRKIQSIGDAEVCDITVEDNHNFVTSQGVLMHNCDDLGFGIGSCLERLGIASVVACGTVLTRDGIYGHAWVEAWLPSEGAFAVIESTMPLIILSDIWEPNPYQTLIYTPCVYVHPGGRIEAIGKEELCQFLCVWRTAQAQSVR